MLILGSNRRSLGSVMGLAVMPVSVIAAAGLEVEVDALGRPRLDLGRGGTGGGFRSGCSNEASIRLASSLSPALTAASTRRLADAGSGTEGRPFSSRLSGGVIVGGGDHGFRVVLANTEGFANIGGVLVPCGTLKLCVAGCETSSVTSSTERGSSTTLTAGLSTSSSALWSSVIVGVSGNGLQGCASDLASTGEAGNGVEYRS